MGEACSTNWESRTAYKLFGGTPERNRPLGRSRRRWVHNIKMNLVEIGWGNVDCIGLVQDRASGELQ
jgi:hypothetical protein